MQSPVGRGRTLSEEQFSCSICLEVFVEPVSTPCGHSFCKACLEGFWNHSKKFLCPMCKKSFSRKPDLCVNRVLAEIAEQFQDLSMTPAGSGGGAEGGVSSSPLKKDVVDGDFAKPGEVPCDACIGRKMKAVKSCLSCPKTFCSIHLLQHKKNKNMSKHKVVEPVMHLETKLCWKHERLLEAYCRNDHACVCRKCAETTHKDHDIITIEREHKKILNQLGQRRSELKHLIKERTKKLEDIKQSIKVMKMNSQKEIEESWMIYAELQKLLEQSQAQLVENITFRNKQAEEHARELANSLEHELSVLKNRSKDLELLSETQDKVLFLQQMLPSLPPAPEATDWSAVTVNTDLYLGSIRKSVSALIQHFQEEVKQLYGKELRKIQNYASEVFMDPATAQRNLNISEDGRQVHYEENRKTSSQSEAPRRFSPALFVLAREGLSSGRHYWEVDVGRKTSWTLGVARASAKRKGDIRLSPEGGFWCLWLKNGEVKALASSRIPLQVSALPHKLGVYLDHEAGQVSFYDVKAQLHLFTFQDTFGESLYPIFSPGDNQGGTNTGALVITPIKHG